MAWTMNHAPKERMDMSPEAEAKRKATAAKKYANWFAKLSPGEQKRLLDQKAHVERLKAEGVLDNRGKMVKR